jgi:hypothetical protein
MSALIKHRIRSTYGPDGVVMLDIDQGLMVSINVVGAKIWERLERSVPVDRIINELSTEFEVPTETIAADVVSFLQSLADRSLIDWPQRPESTVSETAERRETRSTLRRRER